MLSLSPPGMRRGRPVSQLAASASSPAPLPLHPGHRCFARPPARLCRCSQPGAYGDRGWNQIATDRTGFLVCRMGSQNASSEAGRYPLFVEPRDNGPGGQGYGQPFFSIWASQNPAMLPAYSKPVTGAPGPVTTQSIGFGVTVFPVVHNVSVQRLGTGGGALVRITGDGFSVAGANEVALGEGDVPCAILESSRTHILCRAGAASGSTPGNVMHKLYPGGAGLLNAVYISSDLEKTWGSESWYAVQVR